MKTKMICFIAFISYTFYLTAGDIYVSPYGNDKAAGTRQSPLQTLEQAIKQAREWRRLQSPETTGGINILLEEGIYPQYKSLFIYNPQIQISAESETKRSIFREKDKTKRSKKESAQHSKSRNKSFVMTSVSAL